ncbi:MAG: hypothetical protein ABH829_00340 [archaeon]
MPKKLCVDNSLHSGDILKLRIGEKTIFVKLKRRCKSLTFTISAKIGRMFDTKENVTIMEKLELRKPDSEDIVFEGGNVDLYRSLPIYSTRAKLEWNYCLLDDSLLLCIEPKHVRGTEFKYIIVPQYLDVEKLGLMCGLIFSDGFKKFGFEDFYGEKCKTTTTFQFTNGDPCVIKLFTTLTRDLLEIEPSEYNGNLSFPQKLSEEKTDKIRRFWEDSYGVRIKLISFRDTKNNKCPWGIATIRIHKMVLAEFVVSLLRKLLKWTLCSQDKLAYIFKKEFIRGALIGDGSPILDKGVLRRYMISIETKKEGELYVELLNSLGIESRLLWTKDEKVAPYLRKVDLRGEYKFLEKIVYAFPLGIFINGDFLGSLEKELKALHGLFRHSKCHVKDHKKLIDLAEKIDVRFKADLYKLKEAGIQLPKVYEEYCLNRIPLPIKSRK